MRRLNVVGNVVQDYFDGYEQVPALTEMNIANE
jgi:hypothetical protein